MENNTENTEYSITKFRADYLNLFESKALPILSTFENERKNKFKLAVILSVIIMACAVALFFFAAARSGDEAGSLKFIGLGLICAYSNWHSIKKSFENKIKNLVMPVLMKAFHNFYWQKTPPVTLGDIKCARVFNTSGTDVEFDDCFLGSYRGVDISISECEFIKPQGRSSKTIFEGVVVRLDMNKKFQGLTVVRPMFKSVSDLSSSNMEKIDLEDVEFCDEFVVYADDQIESRYLLTTSFMERLKSVSVAFDAVDTYCSFYENSVYIALDSSADLFNLCSLTREVTDRRQFEKLFEEFVSILELVDHFRLDKRLGL